MGIYYVELTKRTIHIHIKYMYIGIDIDIDRYRYRYRSWLKPGQVSCAEFVQYSFVPSFGPWAAVAKIVHVL